VGRIATVPGFTLQNLRSRGFALAAGQPK
jgi:hypothetical protein